MTSSITIYPETSNPPPAQALKAKAPNLVNDNFFASFSDALDVINPLQHIPVVSDAYRAMTQDTISPGSKLLGGALFGGPIGFASALLSAIFQDVSGDTVGGQLYAMMDDGPEISTENAASAYQNTYQLL
ncbi:MAG: hypothetical protein SFT92_05065 [Rickettsiales bacterium]|nr:hypothetical protein [Rickettsiales bacterium]